MRALLLAASLAASGPEPDPHQVAVVAASTDDPLVRALEGELGTLGFATETHVDDDDDVTLAELREIARREGVAAAIWVSPDHSEVVVWVDGRGKARAIVRELPVSTDDGSEALVVLRVVELLRASLRDVETTTADPTPTSELEPPLPTAALPWPRWLVDLGPALAAAPGGIGVSPQIWMSVRLMPDRHFGIRLSGLAPTVGPQIRDDEGRARVSIAQVVAGPHVVFRPADRIVQPDVGLGLGVSVIRVDGDATPPFVSMTDHIVGFTARIGAGLAFVVHPAWAIRLDGAIGVSAPLPQVAFGTRTVARWGQPYALGAVAVEARFGRR